MSRPDGEVVAPLPEGWTAGQHEAGQVRGPGWRLMEVDATGDDLVITAHPDDWEPTAPTSCVVRALHDAGQLDAYRERCEVAVWRRFHADEPETYPSAGQACLLDTAAGQVWLGTWRHDGLAMAWLDNNGAEVVQVTHWRPLPAGPVLP